MKKFARWTLGLVFLILVAFVLQLSALAAALSGNRDTPERAGELLAVIQGSNTVYAGSLLAVDADGLAQPASDTAALSVLGRAEAYQVNTGTAYDATRVIVARRGVFRWANGGSFDTGDIGQLCYVADDQTVTTAASASNDIIAGWIVDVDDDGVWVDTRNLGSQGASSVASLSVSGNAAVGGTLAVTGAATVGGNTTLGGNASVATNLTVAGTSTLTGAVGMTGAASVGNVLTVAGSASVGTNLTVAGTSAFTGAMTGSNVTFSGSAAFTGLPTVTNGLTTGKLWNDSGAVKVF